jgi:hypothetical protein
VGLLRRDRHQRRAVAEQAGGEQRRRPVRPGRPQQQRDQPDDDRQRERAAVDPSAQVGLLSVGGGTAMVAVDPPPVNAPGGG